MTAGSDLDGFFSDAPANDERGEERRDFFEGLKGRDEAALAAMAANVGQQRAEEIKDGARKVAKWAAKHWRETEGGQPWETDKRHVLARDTFVSVQSADEAAVHILAAEKALIGAVEADLAVLMMREYGRPDADAPIGETGPMCDKLDKFCEGVAPLVCARDFLPPVEDFIGVIKDGGGYEKVFQEGPEKFMEKVDAKGAARQAAYDKLFPPKKAKTQEQGKAQGLGRSW